MRRLLLAVVLSALIPSVAQARYLHVSDARGYLERSLLRDVGETVTAGHCWRDRVLVNPHVVTCAVTSANVPLVLNGVPVLTTLRQFVTVAQHRHYVRLRPWVFGDPVVIRTAPRGSAA